MKLHKTESNTHLHADFFPPNFFKVLRMKQFSEKTNQSAEVLLTLSLYVVEQVVKTSEKRLLFPLLTNPAWKVTMFEETFSEHF